MKCKSLILGPAAALLVAPSGALAADAMMKDDMGPVTACEAYGSGWFFSPGTETCLRIDGFARGEFTATSVDGKADSDVFKYRARVNLRANSETEFGTLGSFIRIQGSGSGATADGGVSFDVDRVLLSLDGLRLGFTDDYWSTGGAYGYYEAANDGPYGFGQGWLADYTFHANGFNATVGLTDSGRSEADGAGEPDFYVGVGYSGGGLSGAIVYYNAQTGGKDAVPASAGTVAMQTYTFEQTAVIGGAAVGTLPDIVHTVVNGSTPPTAPTGYTAASGSPVAVPAEAPVVGNPGSGGGAWKIRADYDLSFVAPSASIGGWYSDDGGETEYVGGTAWGVTGKVGLGDDLTLYVGYGQTEDETVTTAFVPATPVAADVPDDTTTFTIGLSWRPVAGLLIQPEYTATEYNPLRASTTGNPLIHPVDGDGDALRDSSAFNLRIVRSF